MSTGARMEVPVDPRPKSKGLNRYRLPIQILCVHINRDPDCYSNQKDREGQQETTRSLVLSADFDFQ